MVPSEFIELAQTILLDLITLNKFGGYAGLLVVFFSFMSLSFPTLHILKLLQIMIVACNNLKGISATIDEMDEFDASLLKWDPSVHP